MIRRVAGRRITFRPGATAALILSLAVSCREAEDELAPPSVVLISLDTLRQDHCGFHGYGRDTTPFLDSLAEDSLVFDRAYTTASWTLIAHMSMFTGLFPGQHRVMVQDAALTEAVPTLPQQLADAGAVCVGVHYPGWTDAKFGFGRGFEEYPAAKSVVEAEERLADLLPRLTDRWGFLFVHLFDIHSGSVNRPGSRIYDVPAPYDTLFDAQAPELLTEIDAKEAFYTTAEDFTPRMNEAVVALYDGGIRLVDDRLAAWFAEWREAGLLDNAIVVITSDHGEGLAQRTSTFGGHGEFYEEGLRVPLMIHATPKAKQWLARKRDVEPSALVGRRSELVSHVDILPTVLDALDLAAPIEFPGHSLLRTVPEDRFVHAQRVRRSAVYRGSEKAVYFASGEVASYVDLDRDPAGAGESRPEDAEGLARAEQLVFDALAHLNSLPSHGGATKNGGLTEQEREALKSLGYGPELDGR